MLFIQIQLYIYVHERILFKTAKKKKVWLNNSLEYNSSHQISTYNVKKCHRGILRLGLELNYEISTIEEQLGCFFFLLNSSFSKRNTTLINTKSKIKNTSVH